MTQEIVLHILIILITYLVMRGIYTIFPIMTLTLAIFLIYPSISNVRMASADSTSKQCKDAADKISSKADPSQSGKSVE
jgi:hypothetical protein